MDDLIGRQDATDAIEKYYKNKKYITRSRTILSAICFDLKGIMNKLPSAQPEIIRCKECRHGVDYYHDGDCYCSNPKWGLRYFGGSWEFYCADAERRTDG